MLGRCLRKFASALRALLRHQRQHTEGLGLGLYIVAQFPASTVVRRQGDVVDGDTTRFRFTLPRKPGFPPLLTGTERFSRGGRHPSTPSSTTFRWMASVWIALALSLKVAGWSTLIEPVLGVAVGWLLARKRSPAASWSMRCLRCRWCCRRPCSATTCWS